MGLGPSLSGSEPSGLAAATRSTLARLTGPVTTPIVLPVSSALQAFLVAAGVFSIALGAAHLWVPRIFAIDRAIGLDRGGAMGLGTIAVGCWRYSRRRADAVGLAWVMSNAASYVLVSIGVVDLAWAAGSRAIPVGVGAAWIAGWWLLRAGGQFTVGQRRADFGIAAGFAGLAVGHVVVAVA